MELSIDDLFYFFHETTMEDEFHELLIEADIKKINEYLFNYLDMYKFFIFERHDETDHKVAFQQLISGFLYIILIFNINPEIYKLAD